MSTENIISGAEILSRVKKAHNMQTDKELAQMYGLTQPAIGNWKTKNNPDALEIIRHLPPGTDLNWIFFGGDHGASDAEYISVPYRNQQAGAGPGVLVDWPDEPRRMKFRADWVKMFLRTSPENLFLMSARGDSMAPKSLNHDILLVDSSKTRLINHDVYIWSHGVGEEWEVLVKAVEKSYMGPRDGDEEIITLRSINREYHPTDLEMRKDNAHQFRVEGRVVWIGRTLE